MDVKLNLGCCSYKLPNFTNIDIDSQYNPEICMDLMDLKKKFGPYSVDFIYAGHIFEHFTFKDSLNVMQQCCSILKPFRMMISVVPDYSKCDELPVEKAEHIILSKGDHKMLFNQERLKNMLHQAGFTHVIEITDLLEVPYLVVPDVNNPSPEEWQTAYLSYKIF